MASNLVSPGRAGVQAADETEPSQPACPTPEQALSAYRRVRAFTSALTESLEAEDFVIQSMPDTSPTRWHLAHTTWFFETFVLSAFEPGYRSQNAQFEYLFNSYYNAVGEQFPRDRRGLLSRPTVREVVRYRDDVDQAMERLIEKWLTDTSFEDDGKRREEWHAIAAIVQLGIQHEQQHQELVLTDIKHVFSCNPLMPAYQRELDESRLDRDQIQGSFQTGMLSKQLQFISVSGGIHSIGHDGSGFCYDNETPRHQVLIQDCELGNRLITNGEYLEFIADGGYYTPSLWLSAGWSTVNAQRWRAPLYWYQQDNQWFEFTLLGPKPLDLLAPVCHVSFYEADAFARWSKGRLPTEMEWEVFANHYLQDSRAYGTFAEDRLWHPQPAWEARSNDQNEIAVAQVFGDCWQWTSSPYLGYPGYRPVEGAIGEYNGKFMCNQFVLRGGSVATSREHIRLSYRNFFPPDARWQFSGIRLAR